MEIRGRSPERKHRLRRVVEEILKRIGEQGIQVSFSVTFKELTTIRVGGPPWAIFYVDHQKALIKLLQELKQASIPWVVVGKGSNLLASDEGFEGVVISLRGKLANLQINGSVLRTGAGLSLSLLMNKAIRYGLGGLEFLVGIPGTVGGAVRMNAGAFGREIKDLLMEVELCSSEGIHVRRVGELSFGYRYSSIPQDAVITNVSFLYEKSSPQQIREKMRTYIKRRRELQPVGYSMGSVFKNPPGEYAGRLIELAGLKGKRIGGAFVSEKHANFILNDGTATSKEIMALIDLIRKTVQEKTGISLELEVCPVG